MANETPVLAKIKLNNVEYDIKDAWARSAISNLVSFNTSVVASLPSVGVSGTFYFVSNSGTGQNIYDEYLYVNSAWEKVGTTETAAVTVSQTLTSGTKIGEVNGTALYAGLDWGTW